MPFESYETTNCLLKFIIESYVANKLNSVQLFVITHFVI